MPLGLRPISSASLSGRVSGAVAYAYPISDIAANGWLPSSGPDLYPMLDEVTADDADFVYSPNEPTTQTFEVKFGAMTDPSSDEGHIIWHRLRALWLNALFTFALVENATVRATWTHTVTPSDVVLRAYRLSNAEAASITDYSNLRLRCTASAAT